MAKLNKEDFISALKEMTILEVKELVDAMKDELGIDPSVVAVAAAPAAGAEDAGSSTKTVVLKSAGGNKIQVIKLLKEITGLGLVDAKALADNGGNVKENIAADEANQIKAQLEEAGAEIELA
jgi:large subunit ribosomal protein L7/L12